MKYYNVDDVMEIMGCKLTKAYEIIRELNKIFKKKYPDSILLPGKVLRSFFNETMGIEVDNNTKE